MCESLIKEIVGVWALNWLVCIGMLSGSQLSRNLLALGGVLSPGSSPQMPEHKNTENK